MKIKTICVTLSEAEMNDFRKVAEAKSISMSVLARRIIHRKKTPAGQPQARNRNLLDGFLQVSGCQK